MNYRDYRDKYHFVPMVLYVPRPYGVEKTQWAPKARRLCWATGVYFRDQPVKGLYDQARAKWFRASLAKVVHNMAKDIWK